jgi:hypothetical protein
MNARSGTAKKPDPADLPNPVFFIQCSLSALVGMTNFKGDYITRPDALLPPWRCGIRAGECILRLPRFVPGLRFSDGLFAAFLAAFLGE